MTNDKMMIDETKNIGETQDLKTCANITIKMVTANMYNIDPIAVRRNHLFFLYSFWTSVKSILKATHIFFMLWVSFHFDDRHKLHKTSTNLRTFPSYSIAYNAGSSWRPR